MLCLQLLHRSSPRPAKLWLHLRMLWAVWIIFAKGRVSARVKWPPIPKWVPQKKKARKWSRVLQLKQINQHSDSKHYGQFRNPVPLPVPAEVCESAQPEIEMAFWPANANQWQAAQRLDLLPSRQSENVAEAQLITSVDQISVKDSTNVTTVDLKDFLWLSL